ncbi:putative amidophosphoribosyltransferases [Candidatus Termititenax persephonae]|uniref:Amidophosphoribosyltransferases n=1 Tax=Candidatus Termititenax persephonae TaxID=2218525 RepID=A0A388TFT5_9BACT|nr:putative amidophosphoribosyltransferases [Candidatus Termititenax persephonae]
MLKQILQIIFPGAEEKNPGTLTAYLEQVQLNLGFAYCGVLCYDDYARKLVAAVKYTKNRELIPIIQKAFLQYAPAKQADFLIPVPLNPLRLRDRGFNQSEEFAKTYAAFYGIPLCGDLVYRAVNTQKLAALSPAAREKETADIFQVWENKQKLLENKRILIVDDIITTGHTVRNLANALARYNPASIEILGVFRPKTSAPAA